MEDDDSEYVPEFERAEILNGPKFLNQRKEEEVTHGVVQYYIYKGLVIVQLVNLHVIRISLASRLTLRLY